jgi:regulator of protease activity HflC (stomatin/prohibitin superfamily)
MPIELRCSCGQRVAAAQHQGGKRYPCPKCGKSIEVPRLLPAKRENALRTTSDPILAPPETRRGPIEGFSQAERGYPATTGIGRVLLVYFMIWALVFVASVAMLAVSPVLGLLAMAVLLLVTVLLVAHSIILLTAKSRVLRKGEQPLLFGLLNLVAWNPTQGIVVLRNKVVHYVDESLHDGGGIKLIYPMFGEEVALRVPLEPQSLLFEDQDVLTREYLPITVRGTVKWRIVSLEHFYLLVSSDLHKTSDRAAFHAELKQAQQSAAAHHEIESRRKLGLAVEWLRWTAEEQTRAVVSRLSTGLLVADQVAEDLPPDLRQKVQVTSPESIHASAAVGNYRSGTDSLASHIFDALTERVGQYGIEIHEVTLQNVRLPAEIHQKCVEACMSAYTPLIAGHEAAARQKLLQADANVIGSDNLAAREVVGSAPAYALADFLGQYLAKNRALLSPPKEDDLLP